MLRRATSLASVLLLVTLVGCSAGQAAPAIDLSARDLGLFIGDQPAEEIALKAGQTYRIRLTIDEDSDHNLFIGAADDLSHQRYDRIVGIATFRGKGTAEFDYTAPTSGPLQFACVLAGHYGTMHGDIVIEP